MKPLESSPGLQKSSGRADAGVREEEGWTAVPKKSARRDEKSRNPQRRLFGDETGARDEKSVSCSSPGSKGSGRGCGSLVQGDVAEGS